MIYAKDYLILDSIESSTDSGKLKRKVAEISQNI